MSFLKLGESIEVTVHDIKSADSVLSELDATVLDSYILDRFKKTAGELKGIAPKAKDFLYFTAIMMSAAESSLIDDKGDIRKKADGEDISAHWDINEKTGSWKWISNDTDLKPYKNSNGDIFPESELKKAYKKWVGKPLCLDHKSNSVDFIRGIVVDTFYDDKMKRVIALCALDKVNYPDLARKVSTGYATCVSMGTAVGRAICSDCGRVAKVESDFCDHMRSKSCYGEINIDLSPIELSIVVNGADPKAKIRHIVAAANSLAKYVDSKEDLANETKNVLSTIELERLAEDLTHAQETLSKIQAISSDAAKDSEDSNEISDSSAYEQPGRGSAISAETDLENTDRNYEYPARLADKSISDEGAIHKAAEQIINIIEEKIGKHANKIASLQSANKTSEEIEMSNEKKAYFQGAGGANEPAPKQVKYPKEDSDSIRNKEDKHMDGQSETGPVDGIHPGYDSFGESEEARKKKLLRADQDERAIRRTSALEAAKKAIENKKAYHQGGGDVNEPTPGKPKYTKEDSDSTRNKEDKQMTGESPFPGVGKVDGLYGDDLKEKQMLSRAKLNASFVKAANPDGSDNAAESRWQVYADKKLILTATVGEIAGGKADILYDTIATREFGKKLISTIKTQGFDKAVQLFKGAQFAPAVAGPGASPSGPVDAGGPAALPALPADEPVDSGDNGDPIEQVNNHLSEMDNLVSDMKQAVDALKEEDTSDLDSLAPAVAAATSTSLPAMRKTLNASLQKGIKQAIGELEDHIEELNLVKHIYNNTDSVTSENLEFVNELLPHTLKDATATTANVYRLMSAFVKYARGTDALLKKAEEESKSAKEDENEASDTVDTLFADDTNDADPGVAEDPHDLKKIIKDLGNEMGGTENKPGAGKSGRPAPPSDMKPKVDPPADMFADDAGDLNDWKKVVRDLDIAMDGTENKPGAGAKGRPAPSDMKPKVDPPKNMFPHGESPLPLEEYKGLNNAEDNNDAVEFKMNPDGSVDGTADKLSDVAAEDELDLNTKEGRAQMRAKLAQKGVQFSDMLGKAHPSGGATTKLDVKPAGDLAKVEDLEEAHDKHMEVATKAPQKVRDAAEQINKLVIAGRIDPNKDFEGLIANGLDQAAVKYWKQYFGEAKDGGSQFATELVKEHQKKKAEEEMATYRVKVARAYELAHNMAERGMIGGGREAVTEQVSDILTWDDKAFSSMARVVSRTEITKKAAALPVVGYTSDSEVILPAVEPTQTELKDALDAAFRNRRY